MAGAHASERDVDVDLRQLFASLRRNLWLILALTLGVTALALVFTWISTPLYKAETRLLIEARESVFTRPGGTAGDQPIDAEAVTSQVQVITSTDILKDVATRLDLASREEFEAEARPSLAGRLKELMGIGREGQTPPSERVLRAFREKLSVYRVENSRVIVIEFSSADPALAAEIANAVAEAYIAGQRDAKQLSTEAATEWLEPEIEELRGAVREAERKVAEYRAASGLLMGQNNAMLVTQQLAEMSTELSRVRADRAAAEATAEGVRAALASGASLDSLPQVLGSGLIQRLREREVQLKADIADLSTTLLGNHPRIRSLRSQLADLEGQIRAEARKLLVGLENEARTAKLREDQLSADLNRLKAESARAGDEAVELRALEREADSQRELLEAYLARYRQAASRGEGNYAPVDVRIFSRAVAPLEPYFPKPAPIVGAAFAGTLLLAAIGVLLSELFSGRAMRPAVRIATEESATPAAPVAIPVLAGGDRPAEAIDPPSGTREAGTILLPADADMDIDGASDLLIARGVRRAVFLSPEGDEAAASAVLVAREVSDAGLRTILVDMTLSGAASLPMLDGARLAGITDLLAAQAQFSDVIHGDLYSACDVIPSGTADPVLAMRAADRLPMILESLSTAYDMVVIECGPADAAALGRLFEAGAAVMVSTIGTTPAAVAAAKGALVDQGYGGVTVVSPLGQTPPQAPLPDRSAA